MIKDPREVSRLAEQRRDENWRFRTLLKSLPRGRVDSLAGKLGLEAQAQMDCTTCGACCRENCIPVTPDEQARLAGRAGLSEAEFAARYMTTDDDREPAMDARPCPFLSGTICSVYDDRPEPCRGYPYIGGNIATRTIGILERAETCPIVFEMLEQLKAALGFSFKGKRGRA